MNNDFDFESGELCLDFANTNDWHASEHPEEHLHSYADLLAWGEAASIISPEQAELMRQIVSRQPEQASTVYLQAIALREAIFQLFSAISTGGEADPENLTELNEVLGRSMAHLQLVQSGGGYAWDWNGALELDRILWPVARSAAELLASANLDRVHRCEDDRGCGYLFIDTSRNRSRRWCSMETCGNRAKAKRHYARQSEPDE